MTTPPPNPVNDPQHGTAVPAPRTIVLQGPVDGGDITPADEVEWLRPIQIQRLAGGRNLDFAQYVYDDLGVATGDRLVDIDTPTDFAAQLETRLASAEEGDSAEDGDSDLRLLAWGDLTISDISINETGEQQTARARIEPYHFGNLLTGMPMQVIPGTSTLIRDVDVDPIFNPLMDGSIEPNRNPAENVGREYSIWIDPDSLRTPGARELQGLPDGAELWTLPEAIHTLCQYLNPDEEFIRNPDVLDDEIFDDAPILQNFELRRGSYLPALLDALLVAHGYSWCVDLSLDDAGQSLRTIRVFKLGRGPEKKLWLQRPGETLDLSKSNTPELNVELDVARLANKLTGFGSLEVIEITVELKRGWATAGDSRTADELDQDDPGSDYADYPNAWRLWIANEDGSYTGLRPEITAALDLGPAFTDPAYEVFTTDPQFIRRPLGDCLTYDPSDPAKRLRAQIDYYNPTSEEFEPVPSQWGAHILPDHLGIYFSGNQPPADLIALGENARIRVTGTIVGDRRVTASVDKRDSSPTSRTVEMFLDLSDRFHARRQAIYEPFRSQYRDVEPLPLADETDDTDALETYLTALQKTTDAAQLRASFRLFGLQFEYEIGDLITEVDGRKISLNRHSAASEEKQYLQVLGITWDIQNQATILIVDSPDAF